MHTPLIYIECSSGYRSYHRHSGAYKNKGALFFSPQNRISLARKDFFARIKAHQCISLRAAMAELYFGQLPNLHNI